MRWIGGLALCAAMAACGNDEKKRGGDEPEGSAGEAKEAPAPKADLEGSAEETETRAGDAPRYSLIVKRPVGDYAAWKQKFDAGRWDRLQRGIVAHAVSRVAGDEGAVLLHYQGEDPERMRAAAGAEDPWIGEITDVGPVPEGTQDTASAVSFFEVKDYDAWKTTFDQSTGGLEQAGVVTWSVARSVEAPEKVAVHLVGSDPEKLREISVAPGEPKTWLARDVELWIAPRYDVFASFEVEDYAAWKKSFDESAPVLAERGVATTYVGRDPKKPNRAVLHVSARDRAFPAYVNSDEAGEAAEEAGLRGEPTIWITERLFASGERNLDDLEGELVGVVMRQDFADIEQWKQAFEVKDDLRRHGVLALTASRIPDERTAVLHLIFRDAAELEAFINAPAFKKLLKRAGVTGPPTVWPPQNPLEVRRY